MGFGVALEFITADHFVIATKGAVLARFTVEDLKTYAKMSPETITRPFASLTSCRRSSICCRPTWFASPWRTSRIATARLQQIELVVQDHPELVSGLRAPVVPVGVAEPDLQALNRGHIPG